MIKNEEIEDINAELSRCHAVNSISKNGLMISVIELYRDDKSNTKIIYEVRFWVYCSPHDTWRAPHIKMIFGRMSIVAESNSAENPFDVIISTFYIKYLIQSYRLSIGYHIYGPLMQ